MVTFKRMTSQFSLFVYSGYHMLESFGAGKNGKFGEKTPIHQHYF